MFENWFVAIKNHTNNLSDSIKFKTRRLTANINSLKYNFTNKTKTTYYTITKQEETDCYENDYLSPRAYSMTTFSMDYNAVNENMEWFPYVPPSYDEQNIVDRFIKVITINDEQSLDVSEIPLYLKKRIYMLLFP